MTRNRSDSRRPIFNATLRAAASWLFFLRRGGTRGDITILCETVP